MARRIPRGRDGGLTFLEVVISLAMVATVSAMITGAIGFMERAHRASVLRLDAAEVAHRVIIQQIDDDRLWKQEVNRVELNGTIFEFDLNLEVLMTDGLGEAGGGAGDRSVMRNRATNEATFNDRLVAKLHLVTARVWAVDPPQGGTEPLAELTRVYNLLDADGDSLFGIIVRMQEEDQQRQIDAAEAQAGGGGGAGGGGVGGSGSGGGGGRGQR